MNERDEDVDQERVSSSRTGVTRTARLCRAFLKWRVRLVFVSRV